ncbi:rhoptry-associated protein 3, putative [Plasmodium knowlesi strain H]|uniref:Rhoptry-associated protein 3, putative n=3 Tax=Plasmodium knowlesi TaxID=5850 RepID=A0A5K1UK37_PLAKH|nr:rhoptry-associated protein 2, putative [Plasmodium knowlesi strain H]OTN67116.1 putative Rhoptry-associated protein 3 [Plasmodium knowlesi]CAA9988827.1 rhoptry-associated protein 2, putative [Plasmodium knowlesi strain H]SBO21842.1 rhoptry-associated protein 3, putative [Plasmodium knowlesi strain H]SBO22209.1 rhoptry-associated protein 3, putative [Plasmodium knowlesi strain H]VVS78301.1 rhoptry-associated protein 2, putative [Plasmodium knowlesi strain H]|eukprot:XP_002259806.1 rhoptry-associated protein 3, putative [Plasmodium knowlesi strain H]
MKVIILISFLVMLFFNNGVDGYNCTKELYNMNLRDLSITSVVLDHRTSRKELGAWVHFFFSHFPTPADAIKYVEDINIYALDNEDQSCFVRAFTIYLIQNYAKDIKSMSNTDNYETFFKNLLKDVHADISNDFLSIFSSPTLLGYIDNLVLKEQDVNNLKNDVNIFRKTISKADRKTHATYTSNPILSFSQYDIRRFRSAYLVKEDPSINMSEVYAARDINFLAFLGVSDMYYNSDITQPARGTSIVINKRKRLGLKKRSTSLVLLGPHNHNPTFGFCEKDGNEDYFGYVDDLLPSFFSVIKTKMIYGHKRFLREFDYSLIHKTYKMPNLKGFRFLKSLFRRKNLENFVDMYSGLMSTELDFLAEDFAELFDITMNCNMRDHFDRAIVNYHMIKEKGMES